jgi:hypothetical protein
MDFPDLSIRKQILDLMLIGSFGVGGRGEDGGWTILVDECTCADTVGRIC